MRFEVEINNEILGDSKHFMSLNQISQFNLVAMNLAKRCARDGNEHSSGMWTVRPHTSNVNKNLEGP